MASQSASQSDVDDQRFAELLKPIKDLTQNWEVPLANLLSTYIDDLQHVTITFDGGETSVNFAEAALLLQGTASVYSKKVEFLWQMVLQTLDMLRSKKEGDEGGDEGGEGGGQTQKGKRKNQLDMTREFGLLEADLGKNIDVKNEDESLEERKNALNFIYITPRQLIEKEGSEQKAVKVNLFMGVQQSKWDLLAGKEDFRINSQYVSVTGGLGEDLTVDNQYLSVSLDQEYQDDTTLPPPSPEQPPPPSSMCASPSNNEDVPPSPHPEPDQSLLNLSHSSIRAEGQHNSTPPPGDCVASLASPPPPLDTTPEPLFDPWAPLDPYQELTTPKPLKRGKTIRLPPSLSTKQKRAKPLPPIEQYLVQEMTASLYNPSMLPNVAPVFYDLAAMELLRRREREKEERMARLSKAPGVRREVFYEAHREEAGQDLFDQFDIDNDDVPDDPPDDIPDNFPDDDLPNPHIGGDVGSLVVEDLGLDDAAGGEAGDSYEELVARRVAEFVHQSQEFLKSSELTQRVAKWHQMIGPRLDRVEQRKAFDVHLYGSGVLNSFPETSAAATEKIPFGQVVRGQKGEEVARYFLSTLMLANTMNVEISTEPGTDPQMGMDNVQLCLLTTTRHHHQLAEFQAASQAETAEQAEGESELGVEEGPSKAKRAKKASSKDTEEPEEMFDELDGDAEEEFRKPKPPAKKKGKKKV